MTERFYAIDITPLRNDETLYHRAYETVGADRRKRLDRIKAERERCLSLGGTLLLRYTLREMGEGEPELAYGEHGKPYLVNQPDVCFNISHSGKYAVCVVSSLPVGCDIEGIKPFSSCVAERCFSQDELAALNALSDEAARTELFFRFWTLKESFLKTLGCGITEPLNAVSFDLSGDAPRVAQTLSGEQYVFREYVDLPGYRCALCRAGDGAFPPLITVILAETL